MSTLASRLPAENEVTVDSVRTDEFIVKLEKVSLEIATRNMERLLEHWRVNNPALFRTAIGSREDAC